MPRSKSTSRKRKKKRVGLYAKSARPFAPEYSTSTISKAINSVYGMPEFPNNPRARDVPGTTHFNIFHRSGVSNGNDVLGQVTSDEFRNHPNNHGADDSGASVTTSVDPDDVFTAFDGHNFEPCDLHVVRDPPPVTVVDLDRGKAPIDDRPDLAHQILALHDEYFGRNDGASTSGVNDFASDNTSTHRPPLARQILALYDEYFGRDDGASTSGVNDFESDNTSEEPIGNDGNRESQNIRDVIDDTIANVDRHANANSHMNQAMTARPQEMPAGPSSAAGAVDDAVLDAYNEAFGIPLSSKRPTSNTLHQTVNINRRRPIRTPNPVAVVQMSRYFLRSLKKLNSSLI